MFLPVMVTLRSNGEAQFYFAIPFAVVLCISGFPLQPILSIVLCYRVIVTSERGCALSVNNALWRNPAGDSMEKMLAINGLEGVLRKVEINQ